jgi:hypothetical protein
MFLKLDQFLSSGEGGKAPTQLGPLERANLNHWKTPVKSQSKVMTASQLANLSWNKAPFWGL